MAAGLHALREAAQLSKNIYLYERESACMQGKEGQTERETLQTLH